MNPLIQLKQTTSLFFVAFGLGCFGFTTAVQAVSPAPDGSYPGGNTAEGQNALLSRTTGGFNTGVGWFSLKSLTTGSFNTGVGAGTLVLNTADQNTAVGAGAMLENTSGGAPGGGEMTEVGPNTALGTAALFSNTTGGANTAMGYEALASNQAGDWNTAVGFKALLNSAGTYPNDALGHKALVSNTTGSNNTAIGFAALYNNTTGIDNVAVGEFAGSNQTTGFDNVYIGEGIFGVAGESNACYIKSIFGQTSTGGVPVFINSDNKLGTATSSKRFKDDIKPMGRASEVLLALKPVTFRYKKAIDPSSTSQFGLVAEEVEKVNPDLVVRDKEGKPYSVRYDQVNAMLLNEFLKEHATVQELKKEIAALKRVYRK
jgi:trimeric autotransporter adhesin